MSLLQQQQLMMAGAPSGGGGGDPNWASRFSLLYFDGTNGSTSITDEVAGNSWAAAGGAQISTAQSKFGGASAAFNGSTSYIASGRPASDFKFLSDGTTPWTLEAWVRPNSVSGTQVIAETGGAATALVGVSIDIASGQLDVMIARGTGGSHAARATGGTLTANQWTYIKVACDGTNLKTFIEGAAAATSAVVSPSSATPNNTLNLGRYANGNTLYLSGYLDTMRLTKGIADFSTGTVPSAPFPNHA